MGTGPQHFPVKVCGLTRADEAAACARLGAAAVGCVFYPESPRRVTLETAGEIRRALPPGVHCVGVFVDEAADRILLIAEAAGLTAVQLHGREPPELASRLKAEGLRVIKALFASREPGFAAAEGYPADAFLIECGSGPLPGGNARAWDWSGAGALGGRLPLILAGGLSPENLNQALAAARPDAVDVSSAVELAPGRKDLEKVRRFIEAACEAAVSHRISPKRSLFP